MATTLDELVVKIRADIKDFRKNISVARRHASTSVGKMRKAFSGFGNSLKNSVKQLFSFRGAMAAVAGAAGLGLIVTKSLDAADSIAKLSSNIGVNAELLQELRFAASQTGVAQNDLDSSLQRFNRRLADAANGSKEFQKGFEALGVQIKDSDGNLRATEDVLLEVADGVQALGSESEQAAALFRVFGDSGFRLVNLFKGGSSELNRFQTEARELGLILSDEVLESAEKTNDQLDVMKKVIGTQLTKAVVDAAPAIQELADTIADIVPTMVGLLDAGAKVLDWVTISKEEAAKLNETFFFMSEAEARAAAGLKPLTESTKEHTEASKDATKAERERAIAAQKAAEERLEAQKKIKEERDKLKADAESVMSSQASREDSRKTLVERLEEEREILQEARDKQIEGHREYAETIKALDQEIADAKVKAEEEKNKKILGATASLSNSIMTLSKGKNKELFQLAKAGSTATAIINTYEGATKALAQGGIVGPVMAAAVIASGMAQVAQIQAQQFNRGIDSVPGIGNQDSVPAILTPGERVVPKETNKDLKEFMQAQKASQVPAQQAPVININIAGDFLETDEGAMKIVNAVNLARRKLGAVIL